LQAETDRVHKMLESGDLPAPVSRKVLETLAVQRDEILAELAALEASDREP
jgi:hypothetical protein